MELLAGSNDSIENSPICHLFRFFFRNFGRIMFADKFDIKHSSKKSHFFTDAVEVAIPRKAKVSSLPDWPEIRIHYFTEERFSAGIEVQSQNGMAFQIYDIEKTVADILYYRERVGIEETKEVMLNYLRREDRNLNKLICYANQLKCANVLNYYLEVLL